MTTSTKDIEKQLREAIMNSDLSQYEIAKRSGVAKSQLSLFVNDQRSLTLTSAAKIARVLDLELVKKERKRKEK